MRRALRAQLPAKAFADQISHSCCCRFRTQCASGQHAGLTLWRSLLPGVCWLELGCARQCTYLSIGCAVTWNLVVIWFFTNTTSCLVSTVMLKFSCCTKRSSRVTIRCIFTSVPCAVKNLLFLQEIQRHSNDPIPCYLSGLQYTGRQGCPHQPGFPAYIAGQWDATVDLLLCCLCKSHVPAAKGALKYTWNVFSLFSVAYGPLGHITWKYPPLHHQESKVPRSFAIGRMY